MSSSPAKGSGKKPQPGPGAPPATGSHTFSHADFTYVRRKRGRPDLYEEEMGELNIVPYLDVMVNLIMFLLVSQATLVSLGVIDVTAPSYAAPGSTPASSEKKETLRLTLGVAKEGFYIAAKGGVVGSATQEEANEITPDGVTKRPPTIPLKNGGFDYPALKVYLREIKSKYSDASAVYLTADSNIPYDVIVKTLDASRSDRDGELFPDVAFSRIN